MHEFAFVAGIMFLLDNVVLDSSFFISLDGFQSEDVKTMEQI